MVGLLQSVDSEAGSGERQLIRVLIIACLVFVGLSACSPVSNTGAPSDSFSAQNSGSDASTENTSGTGDAAYTDPDGRRGTYNGQWQNGTPHGRGRVEYDDGSTFVGSFVAGQRSGQGTQTSPDGHRYEGCLLYTSPSPRDS